MGKTIAIDDVDTLTEMGLELEAKIKHLETKNAALANLLRGAAVELARHSPWWAERLLEGLAKLEKPE